MVKQRPEQQLDRRPRAAGKKLGQLSLSQQLQTTTTTVPLPEYSFTLKEAFTVSAGSIAQPEKIYSDLRESLVPKLALVEFAENFYKTLM